jgi:PST family polysaccharide transporter
MTGVMWAYIAFFGEKLIVFGTTALIARYLVPDEFGLIATALLVLAIADALRDLGLKDALIYIGEEDGHADTAFWLNLALGLVLMSVTLAIAPAAARWLAAPELAAVLAWMAPAFLLNALGGAHEALLQHRLLFARRYLVDFASAALKAGITVVLIVGGHGVWAVVYAFLAGALFRAVGRWLVLPWIPRLAMRLSHARDLVGYGKSVVLVSLVDLPLLMADQLAITVLLGQTALAYYYIAARIPDMVLQHFNIVAARVVFPIFASLRGDHERLAVYTLETARYTSFAVVPMSIGLAAIADLVIPAVFGWQWEPSIGLLVILSLAGLAYALTWSIGDALKAIGRPDVLARLTLIDLAYLPALVVGGVVVSGEPIGAGAGMLLGFMISNVIRLVAAADVLAIRPMRYLACYRSAAIAALVMLGVVVAAKAAVDDVGYVLELVAAVALGAVSYVAVLWHLERGRLLAIVEVARSGRTGLPEPSDG